MPSTNSGIRDNHSRGNVADFLKAKVQTGSRLSVVSAYFTIYAYEGQPSRPLIEAHPNLLDVAKKHLANGDLMATAVYVRAAFETRVRNVCEKEGVEIAFKPNPKEVKVDKLWEGIVKRQQWRQDNGKPDFIDPALMRDVETMRSTILNQLSHSGSPSLGTKDVQFALDTTRRLDDHKFTKVK